MLGCPPTPLPAQHQAPEAAAKAPAPSSAQIRLSSVPLPLLFPCQVPFTPNPLPPCLSSQGRELCSLIPGETSWSLGLMTGMSPASPAHAFPVAQVASANLTLPRARHGATPPTQAPEPTHTRQSLMGDAKVRLKSQEVHDTTVSGGACPQEALQFV